jgi:hypothetical protein
MGWLCLMGPVRAVARNEAIVATGGESLARLLGKSKGNSMLGCVMDTSESVCHCMREGTATCVVLG